MKVKTTLLDSLAIERSIKRLSHEIVEKNKGVSDVVLLGIAKGGVPFAQRIRKNIEKIEGELVPIGIIDITLYRDDVVLTSGEPKVNGTSIDFSLQDKHVILCDDVLYTGRTVRAALECIFKFGRPKTIQLAVLIDRGHRELPFRADYVGKNVPTSNDEVVRVTFDENGEEDVTILV